jgi:septal ring factor EnvC (AmiA/AmiB activator)
MAKVKKFRKKRVLTEEQKQANRERLAKAREARQAKRGNAPPVGVHPSVAARSDDDPMSLKNIRDWIKYNKAKLVSVKTKIKNNEKGAIAEQASIEGYIRNMESYIRHGVWVDLFYGPDQQHRCTEITIVHAG